MKQYGLMIGISLAVVIAFGAAFAASVKGDSVTISDPVLEDLYLAGKSISVEARVEGDLVAAGRNLVVDAEVQGDVLAAGEVIRLLAPVGDDVRMAGRSLMISDRVGGHLVATGNTIVLGQDGEVTDWAWLAGRELQVQGSIGPGSKLAGRTVILSGDVSGDLTVYARQLVLTSTARINGSLDVHTSNPPQIDNEAQITGELRVHEDTETEAAGSWYLGFGLAGALIAMVTSVVIYLLFPAFMVAGADRVKTNPFKSFGLAIVFLVGIPIVVALLFMTGLGAVLGLVLLAVYLLMLLVGSVTGSVFLAALGLRFAGKEESAGRVMSAVALALAIVLVQLVQMIPVGGSIATFVLFLVGLGAAVATAWRRYREG